MLDPGTRNVLLLLADAFSNAGIFWILGGHAGLILQGVDIDDDGELDICSTAADASRIVDEFPEQVVDALARYETGHLRALRGTLEIDGTHVEFFGDPSIRVGEHEWVGTPPENICRVEFEGRSVPVFTLESEHRLYAAATWKPKRNLQIAEKIAERL